MIGLVAPNTCLSYLSLYLHHPRYAVRGPFMSPFVVIIGAGAHALAPLAASPSKDIVDGLYTCVPAMPRHGPVTYIEDVPVLIPST